MIATPYGFRIVGDCTEARLLVDHAAAFRAYAACDARAQVEREAYLSLFTFGENFRQHLTRTGSTKGYGGECGAPVIWFDIDRDGDLPRAQDDAGRLASALAERYGLAGDALLLFFSGSKGFHVGLPTTLWNPPPSAEYHRIARQFCGTLAQGVGVVIDAGVYDKVRAFRAPNSRHPKTGLHKRRLEFRDLLHLDVAEILAAAKEPAPFIMPELTPEEGDAARALEDWTAAIVQVEQQAEAKAVRRHSAQVQTLNARTMEFIRDGAGTGDRHRLLFSAAANLAEFDCPPTLAHALLTESGLDTGLSPSEVKRQIDCGLAHKGATP